MPQHHHHQLKNVDHPSGLTMVFVTMKITMKDAALMVGLVVLHMGLAGILIVVNVNVKMIQNHHQKVRVLLKQDLRDSSPRVPQKINHCLQFSILCT